MLPSLIYLGKALLRGNPPALGGSLGVNREELVPRDCTLHEGVCSFPSPLSPEQAAPLRSALCTAFPLESAPANTS